MQIDLNGRRALVTGAGSGIGAAIARALGASGADVAVHYANSKTGADDVVDELTGLGRRAVAIGGDLTDPAQASATVAAAVAHLGGLDILVTNAGHLVGRATVAEMSDAHWAQVMAVNVSSTFFVTRAAVPHLTDSPAGRVVLMSSLAAENGGGAGSVAYAAAKAAIVGFGRGLAKELAGAGVTVNALAPGFIGDTAFHNTFTPAQAQQGIVSGIPLQRAGTVDDVAGVSVFLASGLSSYVTGQVIDINGGMNFR
ncbi:SDR family NAD(P)-dependent oxidoreductase [Pengzhenrongella frigida]|uniref:SDR family oxidoreductase n=1 Tax=Pengzhenrongella frigida TaxID=1259133 RepID=A0A4Q5N1Y1_9MICO|nr:SDR family oxidoreductase [Cellulomonas sp. HLT2-17]RYV52119.1 SDR family oxidoreductase [Cellulomonas sp. HLT2-17]